MMVYSKALILVRSETVSRRFFFLFVTVYDLGNTLKLRAK
jgi:hypothetical protein